MSMERILTWRVDCRALQGAGRSLMNPAFYQKLKAEYDRCGNKEDDFRLGSRGSLDRSKKP
jgi:hypothetical protein